MNERYFTLVTTCPAGHSFGLRRSLSTWRASVQMPSVGCGVRNAAYSGILPRTIERPFYACFTPADGQGRLDDGAK